MTKKPASKTSPTRAAAKPAARASRSAKRTSPGSEPVPTSASHEGPALRDNASLGSASDSERPSKKPSARATSTSPGELAAERERSTERRGEGEGAVRTSIETSSHEAMDSIETGDPSNSAESSWLGSNGAASRHSTSARNGVPAESDAALSESAISANAAVEVTRAVAGDSDAADASLVAASGSADSKAPDSEDMAVRDEVDLTREIVERAPETSESGPLMAEAELAPPASAETPSKSAQMTEFEGQGPEATEFDATAREFAERLILQNDPVALQLVAEQLSHALPATEIHASRVIDFVVADKPELLVPVIDRLAQAILGKEARRSVQTAAHALPIMARVAPAKVARQLPALTDGFASASESGKHGLVCTFAALCTASVAYQKRLEPVLDTALSTAPAEKLLGWAEIILPALKGEPHARARDVVEDRLPAMPRATAQPIAAFLGVRLRPTQR